MPPIRRPGTRPRKNHKGRFFPRRKVCSFCANKVKLIDYKNVIALRRYISDRGRIEPRRKTGVCPKHQRALSVALKRARHLALLPYTAEHIRLSGGLIPREMGGFAPRESGHAHRLSGPPRDSAGHAPKESSAPPAREAGAPAPEETGSVPARETAE
ncbi:MAG: 30S ribosomal protein S18 [Dehalococcoidia bacterium]|nr:30S ribosomal protein S18 [Dehalococcoidia bacterium]